MQDKFRQAGIIAPSLGTMSEVLTQAKRADPTLEESRKLVITLKKIGGDVLSCLRGAALLDALQENGFTIRDSDRIFDLCHQILGGRPLEVVDSAHELLRLQKVTGKTHTELVNEYRQIAGQIADLSGRINQLTETKKKLEESIRRLEGAEKLSEELERADVAVPEIKTFLALYKEQKELGLDRYTKIVGQAESAQLSLTTLQAQERQERSKVANLAEEQSALQAKVQKLRQEQDKLQESLEGPRQELTRIQNTITGARKELAKWLDAKDETFHILASIKLRKQFLEGLSSSLNRAHTELDEIHNRVAKALSCEKDVEKIRQAKEALEQRLAQINGKLEAEEEEYGAFCAFQQLLRDPEKVGSDQLAQLQKQIESAAKAIPGGAEPHKMLAPSALERAKASLVEVIAATVKDRMIPFPLYETADKNLESTKRQLEAAKQEAASSEERHRQETAAKEEQYRQELAATKLSWEKKFEESRASWNKRLQESEEKCRSLRQQLDAATKRQETERTEAASAQRSLRQQLETQSEVSKKLTTDLQALKEVKTLVEGKERSLGELQKGFLDFQAATVEERVKAGIEKIKEEQLPEWFKERFSDQLQEKVEWNISLLAARRIWDSIYPILKKALEAQQELTLTCDKCRRRLDFRLQMRHLDDLARKGAIWIECPNPGCGDAPGGRRGFLGLRSHLVRVRLSDILYRIGG